MMEHRVQVRGSGASHDCGLNKKVQFQQPNCSFNNTVSREQVRRAIEIVMLHGCAAHEKNIVSLSHSGGAYLTAEDKK